MTDDRREVEMSLARRLYGTMERLDPGLNDEIEWESLTERDREFYQLCVHSLVEDRESLLKALKLSE